VAVHAFNPSTWEAETGRQISEFKAILVYGVSSRTARAIQRNPVSKPKPNQKKKKKRKDLGSLISAKKTIQMPHIFL
jgi:hypothetical protein